jgi:uncharacterized protein YndB with AHSA1/START domain
MADILQDFIVRVPPARVYEAVSSVEGLNEWWTRAASGTPAPDAEYELDFGPGYVWRAVVTKAEPPRAFELRLVEADADWTDTIVGFELDGIDGGTRVRFHHLGWPEANPHYRTSCHCWALYLRVLRRHLEHGETVPYERRLDV